jgi:hypothetical protein
LRTAQGVVFDRVFYKFKENNFEKVDRLIELYNFYTNKVRTTEDDENDGFYTLQLISFTINFLYKLDDFDLNSHFNLLLNMHDLAISDIQKISLSYTKTFGLEENEPDEIGLVDINDKNFKSVSQNPSESESEEIALGNKRMKLDESVLNTDNMQQ